jgi:hypothetical protein
MRLAGRANWWAPGPLARFYQRFGLTERDLAPSTLHHGTPPAVIDPREAVPVASGNGQSRGNGNGNRNVEEAAGAGRKPPGERIRERPLRADGR